MNKKLLNYFLSQTVARCSRKVTHTMRYSFHFYEFANKCLQQFTFQRTVPPIVCSFGFRHRSVFSVLPNALWTYEMGNIFLWRSPKWRKNWTTAAKLHFEQQSYPPDSQTVSWIYISWKVRLEISPYKPWIRRHLQGFNYAQIFLFEFVSSFSLTSCSNNTCIFNSYSKW